MSESTPTATAGALEAWRNAHRAFHAVHDMNIEAARNRAALAIDAHTEALRRENNTLKTILAKVPGVACLYCGLEDMSKCALGFPGCSKGDDIICGEDEHMRHLLAQVRTEKKP